jgi:hypothetical protein
MKSKNSANFIAMALLGVLATPVRLNAQEQKEGKEHRRYKLVDVGTLGGPTSYFAQDLTSTRGSSSGVLNNQGRLVGAADTSTPDPDYLPGSGFFPK